MRFNALERIGVYKSGLIFSTEINWVFREQPVADVGIDAIIEESINGNPTGRFLASQIKSGIGNFHETKDSFTYYVSNVHYHYWTNLNLPIILIGYVKDSDTLYWEIISKETLVKTVEHWKIEIPKTKVLNGESKSELESIIGSDSSYNFYIELVNGNISIEQVEELGKSYDLITEAGNHSTNTANLLFELSKELSKYTMLVNQKTSKGLDDTSREVKTLISKVSRTVNEYSSNLKSETKLFSEFFGKGLIGLDYLSKVHFYISKDYAAIKEMQNSVILIRDSIRDTKEEFKKMRNAASTLPRKYNNLNSARLNFVEASNYMINEYKVAVQMSNSLINDLNEILD